MLTIWATPDTNQDDQIPLRMAFKKLLAPSPGLAGEDQPPVVAARTFRTTVLALAATTFLLTSGCFPGLGHCAANKESGLRAKPQKELVRRDKSWKQRHGGLAHVLSQKRQGRTFQTVLSRQNSDVAIKEDPSHSGGLFVTPPKKAAGETNAEDFGASLEVSTSLPLGKPVPTEISSAFGVRNDPLNRKRAFHEGLDFRGNIGDPVVATGGGTVMESGYRPDYGEFLLISHGKGIDTFFAHLSKRLVQAGDRIGLGQQIGLVGKTGRSTGAHLHYEVHHQGRPINPMRFVLGVQPTKPDRKVALLAKAGKRAVR